jgi:copper ion binding protein
VKIAAFAAAALLALSAHAADKAPAAPAKATSVPAKAAAAAGTTAVIPVKGMHCGGCVGTVTDAVKKLDGVKSVDTDLEKAQTTVVFDAAKVKPEQIVAAIAATGYEPGKPQVKK